MVLCPRCQPPLCPVNENPRRLVACAGIARTTAPVHQQHDACPRRAWRKHDRPPWRCPPVTGSTVPRRAQSGRTLVRPFVRHPPLLEANPWLISTRLARVRQGCADDIHRQQSVTPFCQQPGQHTDGAARLEARTETPGSQACDRSLVFRLLICARAELPRVGTCIIETLEMRGIA